MLHAGVWWPTQGGGILRGGRGARVGPGALGLLLGSMAASQPPHLLAALRLDDAEDAVHQQGSVVPQARLQALHQHLPVRAEDAQGQQDAALRGLHLPPTLPVYLLQPLLQPGAHGVQEVPSPSEKLRPELGQDAAHGLWPGSALLIWGQCPLRGRGKACHKAVGAISIPAVTSVSCVAGGLPGASDDALQTVFLLLRKADGGDQCSAERAGALTPQPAQDAAQAKLVVAGQDVSHVPWHLAADGAAPLPPPAGHVAFWFPASALPRKSVQARVIIPLPVMSECNTGSCHPSPPRDVTMGQSLGIVA